MAMPKKAWPLFPKYQATAHLGYKLVNLRLPSAVSDIPSAVNYTIPRATPLDGTHTKQLWVYLIPLQSRRLTNTNL